MPVSINNTTLTFNDGTTMTSRPVTSVTGAGTVSVSASTGAVTITGTGGTGTVTSVATGNGLSGGTITTTGTLIIACPTFNTVGSYVWGAVRINAGQGVTQTSGSNYSAGTGNGNIGTNSINSVVPLNNLSGTWKYMGGTFSASRGGCDGDGQVSGVYCRVS